MEEYSLEPAARLINTIGKDLIKDVPAAIVELVKNSYDADADFVEIEISEVNNGIELYVRDNGHGMSKDKIINVWIVPGTDFKYENKVSPSGRIYQGRKGIGRYAVSILGNYTEFSTIQNSRKTVVKIDWNEFEKKKFLKDVKIFIQETQVKEQNGNGTTIFIKGDASHLEYFTDLGIEKIITELKKVISPSILTEKLNFDIKIKYNLPQNKKYKEGLEIIEPFPIMELYHYRLRGQVSESGKLYSTFENKYDATEEIIETEKIPLKEYNKYCGILNFDLKIIDRDNEGIELLLSENNKKTEYSLNKNMLRTMLKQSTGIAVYRNGFRIRPHGEPGFDWLDLDKERVQNPSKKIGSDQVIGYIEIESEEKSKLEEKSARDGLKDSPYYEGLKNILLYLLSQVEERRQFFRRNKNDSPVVSTQQKLENLFNLDNLNEGIKSNLELTVNQIKNDPTKVDVLLDDLKSKVDTQLKEIELKKQAEYKEIKKIFAIYQGHVTLAKIVTVVLHEGRKSLGWFTNSTPKVLKWLNKLKDQENIENKLLNQSIERLNITNQEAQNLSKFFSKLDPFANTRRSKNKDLNLVEMINYVKEIFDEELEKNKIDYEINYDMEHVVFGNKEDFLMCFTNLFENSIYWLKTSEENSKITVSIYQDNNSINIEFIDNGPGISKEEIEKGYIFEPGYSHKQIGTGLGLSIAGEAMERNSAKLEAVYSEKGAKLVIKVEVKE